MKFAFTFLHLDSSPALVKYTLENLEEICRFLLKSGHGDVHFSKSRHQFAVNISVNTKEKYFRATSYHVDIYSAVDHCLEKLKHQFIKVKKTHKYHKRPELSRAGRLRQLNSRLEPKIRLKKAA